MTKTYNDIEAVTRLLEEVSCSKKACSRNLSNGKINNNFSVSPRRKRKTWSWQRALARSCCRTTRSSRRRCRSLRTSSKSPTRRSPSCRTRSARRPSSSTCWPTMSRNRAARRSVHPPAFEASISTSCSTRFTPSRTRTSSCAPSSPSSSARPTTARSRRHV